MICTWTNPNDHGGAGSACICPYRHANRWQTHAIRKGPMPRFAYGTIHKCPKTGTGGRTSLNLYDRNALICALLQSKAHRAKFGDGRALEGPRLRNERNRGRAWDAWVVGGVMGSHVSCRGETVGGMIMSVCKGASNKLMTSVCESDQTRVELRWERDVPAAMCLGKLTKRPRDFQETLRCWCLQCM